MNGVHVEVSFVIVDSHILPHDVIVGRDVFTRPGLSLIINNKGIRVIRDVLADVCLLQSTDINTIDTDLADSADMSRLQKLIAEFSVNFVKGNSETVVNTGEMEIRLKNPNKIVQRHPYRLAPAEREAMKNIVSDLVTKNIVRESTSPYSSPAILVKKKDGSDRLCIDYRELNSNTVRDNYPLPLISEQIDTLGQSCVFSTLDMASGFYQIPVSTKSNSIEKTAFVTPDGSWEFLKMPFGLCNAPAVYQRAINKALGPLKDKIATVYMDDVLVFSKTKEEAFSHLEKVLRALATAGFSFNWNKCKFLKSSVEYLGFIISEGSVKPNFKKIEALAKAPLPTNVKELRQFNGLAGYFRKFVPNFSSIMAPLYQLTQKDAKWDWQPQHAKARDTVIKYLTSEPLLTIFDPTREIEIHTDASSLGYGAVLFQKFDGQLKVIEYYSQRTTEVESRYHSYELETLAVFKALKHFRHYVLGRRFKVITDCNSLKASRHKRDLSARVHRWWAYMQSFDFEVEYRKGERIPHVDFLSRNPIVPNVNSAAVNAIQVRDDWLQAEQRLDPDINRIIQAFENDTLEPDLRSTYEIKNNLLFKKFQVNKNTLSKAIVPKNFRWQIIQRFHDELKHLGWEKTLNKIREYFWFPNMTSCVRTYIDKCLPCKVNKKPSGARQSVLHPINKVPAPIHTLHVDTSGKLSGSRNVKEYVIVIIDAFTKYCYLTPVKDLTAKSACNALRSFVALFGAPVRIVADQGTSFTGKEFQDLCKEWSIEFHEIASGVSRANGQVERFMSVLTNCFTIAENHERRSWKAALGEIQLSLNCTVSRSTGKSPLQLLMGCNRNPPRINALVHEYESLDLFEIRHEAKVRMDEQARRDKERFDKTKAKIRPFSVGDIVVVEKNPRIITKLDEKFSSPCKIIEVCENDRYKVEPIAGGRIQYVCHEKLRKYPESLPDLSDQLDESNSSKSLDETSC